MTGTMAEEVPPASLPPLGGLGDVQDDAKKYERAKSIRLAGRAVRNRWPISDEVREALSAHMLRIITKSRDHRARVNAAKVLVDADKLNMEQEQREQAQGAKDNDSTASADDDLNELLIDTAADIQEERGGQGPHLGGGPVPPPVADAPGAAGDGVPEQGG